MTNSSNCSSNP